MPPTDRKYAKQNLQRAANHCDTISGYLIACGQAFLEQGATIAADSSEWPEEYLRIIETVDAIVESVTMVKVVIEQLEESF